MTTKRFAYLGCGYCKECGKFFDVAEAYVDFPLGSGINEDEICRECSK